MKILKQLVAMACIVVPAVANAECYRTANGSTYCTNTNSTPPVVSSQGSNPAGQAYGQFQRGIQNGWNAYQNRPAEIQVLQGVKNAAACAASEFTAFGACAKAAQSGVRGAQAAGQTTIDAAAGYYQMQRNQFYCGSYWTCRR